MRRLAALVVERIVKMLLVPSLRPRAGTRLTRSAEPAGRFISLHPPQQKSRPLSLSFLSVLSFSLSTHFPFIVSFISSPLYFPLASSFIFSV